MIKFKKKHFSNLNWLEGQPNGKRKQNHVAVDMNSFLIDDVDIKKFCVVCSISDSTMLTLRGACQESVLGSVLCIYPLIF